MSNLFKLFTAPELHWTERALLAAEEDQVIRYNIKAYFNKSSTRFK